MVVFTCNNCGDSLQKPKVAKHYQFQCRTSENLTCVDCHKDFYGQEYVAHTKCITESERYGGQDYVPKPGQNKGERKQQEWINVVKNVIETAQNLTKDENYLLNVLARHENIPRKKAKFLNFIRSVMGNRVNMPVVDSVWSRMEAAFKGSVESAKPQNQSTNGTAKKDAKAETEDSTPDENQENNVAENQNNENISREKGLSTENGAEVNELGAGKKKKSKKREVTETSPQLDDEPPRKKNKKKSAEDIVEDAPNVATGEDASNATTGEDDDREKSKFDWKATIVEIVRLNEGITLKKLRKKVSNRYVNHRLNAITFEKAASRFDKRLPKVTEVSVNEDKVSLS